MEPVLLAAVVLFAGAYAFINGFHDVSNSIATSVRTRALHPRSPSSSPSFSTSPAPC
ncbi:hypothetical protein [Arthrobacter sp. ATA002]|uniref:hypothetical protein n=1 Tax=Arthrobacter sp. ATA002 TaxID=2991715 RepID=UPI002E2FD18F|nr:hypothetical protein [Arthrobacter sp. ATA002]